ncbi:WD40-repeat-containing domain protein [Podospora conica]|nr:WD40-repeat-containing domain protein [Schizothecium conicum]
MQSSDPGHFFETDAEQQTRSRRAAKANNTYGSPVVLKSKLLAACLDPRAPSSAVFVAESAGCVRRVTLDDPPSTKETYRGPITPVSCVAVSGTTVFAGAWDKTIWSWDLATRAPGLKYAGHSDFVKALAVARLRGRDVLISGGADKKILVWDAATGRRLHTMSDAVVNMLSVQDLVVDHHHDGAGEGDDEVVVISASSDPHIRRWRIREDGWEQLVEEDPAVPGAERRTILEHETTVYKLVLGADGEGEELWSASGDGTAKCMSRLKGFGVEDTFAHGDHVRAVAVGGEWVVTAGRDEDLRFWDRTSGELVFVVEGHYDEVTELLVLEGGKRLCSVSIDGTVRTWPLERAALAELVKSQQKVEVEEEADEADEKGGLLTLDEEAELAALMEDDE